jgi:hypothetical protein
LKRKCLKIKVLTGWHVKVAECRVGNPKNLPLCVLFGIIDLVNGIRGIVNVREIRLEGRGKFTLKNMGLEGLTR